MSKAYREPYFATLLRCMKVYPVSINTYYLKKKNIVKLVSKGWLGG